METTTGITETLTRGDHIAQRREEAGITGEALLGMMDRLLGKKTWRSQLSQWENPEHASQPDYLRYLAALFAIELLMMQRTERLEETAVTIDTPAEVLGE